MTSALALARLYFAAQAAAGAAWWVAVFTVPPVRDATLGDIDAVLLAPFDIGLFVVASGLAAVLPPRVRMVAAAIATAWTLLVTAGLAVYATLTGLAGWGVVAMTAASLGSLGALALLVWGRIPTRWVLIGPFAFRTARVRRSPLTHVVGTLSQIVAFWAVFFAAIPAVLSSLEQRWGVHLDLGAGVRVAGVVLFVALGAAAFWSAAALSVKGGGTPLPAAMPNRLVIAGPYRWVRNPMAMTSIAQGAAMGMILSSWMVVAYAVAGALVWNFAVRPHEEADLAARFGADFERYRRDVRCWVPRLRPVPAGTPRQGVALPVGSPAIAGEPTRAERP